MDAMTFTDRLAPNARAGALELEIEAAPTTADSRIAWIDYARGFNILIVVIGHVILGLRSTNMLSDGPWFRVWDARYYNFRMPLFFLLSGLFAERQLRRSAGSFLRDKGATLVYPYFIWSTLQILVQIGLNPITRGQITFQHLLWQPLFPEGQFWFLHVLFFIMLAYFLMRKLGVGPVACLIVSLACYAAQHDRPQASSWPLQRILYYGPFYAFGGLAGLWVSKIRIGQPWQLAAILLAGFGVVAAAIQVEGDPPLPVQMAVTLCGIAAAIALTALLSRSRFMGFLPVLGRYSLEILVAHMLSAAGLRIVLQKVLHVENIAAHVILGSSAGIIGPLLLVWVCNRLNVKYAFRLPRPAKPRPADAPRPYRRPRFMVARASS